MGEDELLLGEISTHRWDAGAEASDTGDRSLIEGPRKKMYEVRDQKNAELGAKKDKASFVISSTKRLPRTIAGIPTPQVLSVYSRVQQAIADTDNQLHEAKLLLDAGAAAESLELCLKAGRGAAAIGRASSEAEAASRAAAATGLLGNLEDYLRFEAQASRMYSTTGNLAAAGNSHLNLAGALSLTGRHADSLPEWQAAVSFLERAGNTWFRARAHWGWARSLAALDDHDAAAGQYLRARIAFEDCGNYDSALEVRTEMTTVNERN